MWPTWNHALLCHSGTCCWQAAIGSIEGIGPQQAAASTRRSASPAGQKPPFDKPDLRLRSDATPSVSTLVPSSSIHVSEVSSTRREFRRNRSRWWCLRCVAGLALVFVIVGQVSAACRMDRRSVEEKLVDFDRDASFIALVEVPDWSGVGEPRRPATLVKRVWRGELPEKILTSGYHWDPYRRPGPAVIWGSGWTTVDYDWEAPFRTKVEAEHRDSLVVRELRAFGSSHLCVRVPIDKSLAWLEANLGPGYPPTPDRWPAYAAFGLVLAFGALVGVGVVAVRAFTPASGCPTAERRSLASLVRL